MSRQWREGLIVNMFKKGNREDPVSTGVLPCLVL